jgi:anti-anti-sigma factor
MSLLTDCRHVEGTWQENGVLVLTVTDAHVLDDVALGLRRDFASLIPQAGAKRIVLDLHRVVAMSSAGVTALISLLRRVREAGGQLVLCGLSRNVAWTLQLCRLIDDTPQGEAAAFWCETDVDTAIARLHRAA